jgi:hypothetical protein
MVVLLLVIILASQFSSAAFIHPQFTTKISNAGAWRKNHHPSLLVLFYSPSSTSPDSGMSSNSNVAQTPNLAQVPQRQRQRQKQKHYSQEEETPIFQEILGPFQPRLFMKFWTKHPLLIRNAFPPNTTSSWPTIQEILTLAREEEDAEVRLITQRSSSHYELTIGYDEPTIAMHAHGGNTTMPSVILLINDVDRFQPSLSDWISQTFSFIPTWRIDDGQMSYSKFKGATIGRHVDNYDVFCKWFPSSFFFKYKYHNNALFLLKCTIQKTLSFGFPSDSNKRNQRMENREIICFS